MSLFLFIMCLVVIAFGVGAFVGVMVAGMVSFDAGYRQGIATEAHRHAHIPSGFTVIDGGAA